jgi:hypothetical protein
MFVSGVFIAAGGRGPEFDRMEELLGGLFFGGMGLLIVAVSYLQLRARIPMRLRARVPGANLAVERLDVRRGDEVTATLTLNAAAEGIRLGIVCVERYDLQSRAYTKGGPITIRQTNEATAYEEWQPVEAVAGEHSRTFRIPRDGPYSYEGDCVSYAWRISARALRRLRADPRLDQPIWVQP